jgi:hypothetical protein
MRTRGERNIVRQLSQACFVGAVLAALAASCGGATQSTTVAGSESHFLTRCNESCGGGLACIGGLCTKGCLTSSDTCSELDSRAICTNRSVEPGQLAVCDVPCPEDDACAGLGARFACEGAFCREVAASLVDAAVPGPASLVDAAVPGPAMSVDAAVPSAEQCESYMDSTPPPVVRGVTILNTSDVTLYVQPYSPGCPGIPGYEPALVHVSTLGASDSGTELNIYGPACAQSCQSVIESGWNRADEGETGTACPELPCPPAKPLGWVPIQPGQSVFESARLEYVPQRLPRGCAEGIVTEAINCQARRVPLDGAYMIAVVVSSSPTCDATCVPQIFSRPVANYFQEDHELQINVPAP